MTRNTITHEVLNDIYVLLEATQNLREFEQTAIHATDIDEGVASPLIKRIRKPLRLAGQDLLEMAFKAPAGELKKPRVTRVQAKLLASIEKASRRAAELSDIEKDGMKRVGVDGNFIRFRVHEPLEKLILRWKQAKMED